MNTTAATTQLPRTEEVRRKVVPQASALMAISISKQMMKVNLAYSSRIELDALLPLGKIGIGRGRKFPL